MLLLYLAAQVLSDRAWLGFGNNGVLALSVVWFALQGAAASSKDSY